MDLNSESVTKQRNVIRLNKVKEPSHRCREPLVIEMHRCTVNLDLVTIAQILDLDTRIATGEAARERDPLILLPLAILGLSVEHYCVLGPRLGRKLMCRRMSSSLPTKFKVETFAVDVSSLGTRMMAMASFWTGVASLVAVGLTLTI